MTNESWARNWANLEACCRDRDLTPKVKAVRATNYREALDFLQDHQWAHAVDICKSGEWFPSIEALRSAGQELPRIYAQGQITDGQEDVSHLPRDERQRIAIRDLAMIREELAKHGIHVADSRAIVKSMPGGREPGSDDE